MKYEYEDIFLEEKLEKIICKLNKRNTEYEDLTFSLKYKPYKYVEATIYLRFGEILLIKIFDKKFQINNTFKRRE